MSLERFQELAQRCVVPYGLHFETGYDGWQSPPSEEPNYYLRVVSPNGVCNRTGQEVPWKGRKWRLSQFMTDGEVVGTAFMAYLTALEHEAREQFTFDGVSVFDSHVDIHKLVQLHQSGDALCERTNTPS